LVLKSLKELQINPYSEALGSTQRSASPGQVTSTDQ